MSKTMHKVLFFKQIHSYCSAVSSTDIFIEKLISLPFIPAKGIRIKQDNFNEEILEITYDVNAKLFKAYTEEDRQLYNLHPSHSLEQIKKTVMEIAKEYVKEFGWTIPNRYFKS